MADTTELFYLVERLSAGNTNHIDAELWMMEAADRIEQLEAKLAKAVAQMQRVKDFRYDPNIGIELNLLEATLAELSGVSCANLKGQNYEGEKE